MESIKCFQLMQLLICLIWFVAGKGRTSWNNPHWQWFHKQCKRKVLDEQKYATTLHESFTTTTYWIKLKLLLGRGEPAEPSFVCGHCGPQMGNRSATHQITHSRRKHRSFTHQIIHNHNLARLSFIDITCLLYFFFSFFEGVDFFRFDDFHFSLFLFRSYFLDFILSWIEELVGDEFRTELSFSVFIFKFDKNSFL